MFIEENMYMRSLRRKRKITIYVPDDYETSNKRYPVLYINDGQNAFFDETSYMKISWGFYDYVQAQNLDVIMVAIPCNNRLNKREDEYGPWRIGKEILMMEYGDDSLEIGGEGEALWRFISALMLLAMGTSLVFSQSLPAAMAKMESSTLTAVMSVVSSMLIPTSPFLK